MEISPLGNDQVKVTLKGRLDTPGVDRVETRFVAAVVPGGRHALVDLSHVEFIGSLGVRMFIAVARSLKLKNARLVLLSPQEQVREVFDHVSLSDIIPVCADETEALSALRA
jgi:anti-sigma B factor antagonist/stage II sporulation protein AA (anti-sigma F factor antagonist)